MDPLTIAVTAGSTFLPSLIDAFTGAGARRRAALEGMRNSLLGQESQLRGEAGPSAQESLQMKGTAGLLDRGYNRAKRSQVARGGVRGWTPEQQMGQTQGLNEGYGANIVRGLVAASATRRNLLREANNIAWRRNSLDVGLSDQEMARQNQFATGLTSLIPSIVNTPKTMPRTGPIDPNQPVSFNDYWNPVR